MGATMDPVPSCWGHSEKSDQRTGLMQVPTVRSERTPGHAGVRQGLSARRRSSLPEQDASLETIDVSGERGQKRRVHQKPMRRRRLALALPLLLAAATPVLGFGAGAHGPAPAMHSGGETSRSALSKVVQSLEQTQDANKNLLAQLRAEMGEWASKLDALRCRVVPGHPDGGKSADCSTASSNGDTMSEVSLDEAGTAAVKAKKHSGAAFADAEDLESAVTSAAGDGSLGNLENEVHSGTTRNVKKSRESVVQRTEMAEMPLSGGFTRGSSMGDIEVHANNFEERRKPLDEVLVFTKERGLDVLHAIFEGSVPSVFSSFKRPGSRPDTACAAQLVCFLDIDKCSIYGQDGNDLAIAMQWMGKGFQPLVELYRRLLNPQLKLLMNQLRMSVEEVPVVLYTMRPQLLRYKSGCRPKQINLRWKTEWHHSKDQVLIPAHIETPREILAEYTGGEPLLQGELQDLEMSFQRLLAIRQVVQEELGLDAAPSTVVCAAMKDVQATAQKLGMKPDVSYLWDDNEVLKGQPHVLCVPPYVAMDGERKQQLLKFLQKELPTESLSEDVSDFMLGAKEAQRSLWRDDRGGLHYSIHECGPDHSRFPIPELPLHYDTPGFLGMCSAESVGQSRSQGGFSGWLAEFWSAAWLKDSEFMESRKAWKETATMVW